MKIEEKKIIRKKIIFYLLLERRKNETKETRRHRVFLCLVQKEIEWKTLFVLQLPLCPSP